MFDNRRLNKPDFRYKRVIPGMGRDAISTWHFAGIVICAALLFGDFFTTTAALSLASAQTSDGGITLSEGNPLMMGIVSDPLTFLMSKLALLGLVIIAAYILRNNGRIAYMPYVIVGGMYLFVVLNNMNLLMAAL
jgi:hypothetical protein